MTQRSKFLNIWFAVFPVWSTALYVWIFALLIPAGGRVSPFANTNSPQFVSWPVFALCLLGLALVMATFMTACFLLERRRGSDARRWWWILLALIIPPIGCLVAYRRATRGVARTSSA